LPNTSLLPLSRRLLVVCICSRPALRAKAHRMKALLWLTNVTYYGQCQYWCCVNLWTVDFRWYQPPNLVNKAFSSARRDTILQISDLHWNDCHSCEVCFFFRARSVTVLTSTRCKVVVAEIQQEESAHLASSSWLHL